MKNLFLLLLAIFATATIAQPIRTDCVFFDSKSHLTKEDVQQYWRKTNGTLYCEKYFIEKKDNKVNIYKTDDLMMIQLGSRN